MAVTSQNLEPILLEIFSNNDVIMETINNNKLPVIQDKLYFDRVSDMLTSMNIGTTNKKKVSMILRLISRIHKKYGDPILDMFVAKLTYPLIYNDNIINKSTDYIDSEALRNAIIYKNNNVEEYEEYLVNLSERWANEHQYNGDLDTILVDNVGTNIEDMKIMEYLFSSMNRISNCLGNSNSLLPYNVVLNGSALGSQYGRISNVYLMEYNDINVVMKTLSDDPLSQLHEYLVGTKINELRHQFANFSYTYGFSRTNNPLLEDDNVVFNGMYNMDDTAQIYVQYIDNSIPLGDLSSEFVGNVVTKDNKINTIYLQNGIINIITIQLLCALLYAHQTLRFKHNDANSGNILIKRLDRIMAIPTPVPVLSDDNTITFTTKYIYSDLLVVLIDYGNSSINHEYSEVPILPLVNIKDAYEESGIINDILLYIHSILVTTNEELGPIAASNINIQMKQLLSNIIMNDTLNNNLSNKELISLLGRLLLSNSPSDPNGTYYVAESIIKYTNNNDQYLHDDIGQYPSVLESNIRHIDIIDNIGSYYLSQYLPTSLPINIEEILKLFDYNLKLYVADLDDELWRFQSYRIANFLFSTTGIMPRLYGYGAKVPTDILKKIPYYSIQNIMVRYITSTRRILEQI